MGLAWLLNLINGVPSQGLEGTANIPLEEVVACTQSSPSGKDFVDGLKKICSDPNLKETFKAKFSQEFIKADNREFMDHELSILTDTLLRIKQDFETVSDGLLQFDNKEYRKRKANGEAGDDPINPLQPRWKEAQKRFNELMAESKKTAEKAAYQAQRYRKVILDMATDSSISREDVMTELQGFIDDIDKLYSDGGDFASKFDSLREEISRFKTIMKIAIADASNHVVEKISNLDANIGDVQAILSGYQTWANIGWVFLAGTGIGVAVGIGLAMMTPQCWLCAVVVALAAVGVEVEIGVVKENWKAHLDELQKNLKDSINRKKEVEELKILFTKTEGHVTDICNSINAIARVWGIFKLEANALRSALVSTRTTKTKPGLDRQIQMAQEQFFILEKDLESYSSKMAAVEA
ncbi:hypothetical protein GYMLUDRAFT_262395 [Collybiopsis luxurians FD-317 M1]|uniref:Karyogamy protein 5 n=1 Tax=Collybiopsis luxurians FD-317 M1 TaxID=944289 RepID=A0A0D0BT71_9AGAR|nr:hypothetical protein GYMLUDRAFT_262395 [Collybiopsis luxurians FD-317 M1]